MRMAAVATVMVVVVMVTLTNLALSSPATSRRTGQSPSPSPAGRDLPPAPNNNNNNNSNNNNHHNHAAAPPTPLQSPPSTEKLCVVLEQPGPCGSGPSWRHGVTLPNLYGHYSLDQAFAQLHVVLAALPAASSSSELVTQFLCTLYLPPCPAVTGGRGGPGGPGAAVIGGPGGALPLPLPLPCRPLCELARGEVEGAGGSRARSGESSGWPSAIRCHMFPTERCYALAGTCVSGTLV